MALVSIKSGLEQGCTPDATKLPEVYDSDAVGGEKGPGAGLPQSSDYKLIFAEGDANAPTTPGLAVKDRTAQWPNVP